MRIIILVLLTLILTGCVAPVTQVTSPVPMQDAPPSLPTQEYVCGMVGTETGFDLSCAKPEPTQTPEPTATMTPEPTPTESPSFWYFWCSEDTRCASGQFRVYWDRDLTMLRCALPQGSKVSRVADGYSLREGEGEPLVWVVTGAAAGVDRVCEGWVPVTFLRAAE